MATIAPDSYTHAQHAGVDPVALVLPVASLQRAQKNQGAARADRRRKIAATVGGGGSLCSDCGGKVLFLLEALHFAARCRCTKGATKMATQCGWKNRYVSPCFKSIHSR